MRAVARYSITYLLMTRVCKRLSNLHSILYFLPSVSSSRPFLQPRLIRSMSLQWAADLSQVTAGGGSPWTRQPSRTGRPPPPATLSASQLTAGGSAHGHSSRTIL